MEDHREIWTVRLMLDKVLKDVKYLEYSSFLYIVRAKWRARGGKLEPKRIRLEFTGFVLLYIYYTSPGLSSNKI